MTSPLIMKTALDRFAVDPKVMTGKPVVRGLV